MVAQTAHYALWHKRPPAMTPAGTAASLHPPSADAALVQATPGSLRRPIGECTLCMCCIGHRHRALALPAGATQTSSFTLCIAKKSNFSGDPWLLPFQLL